MKIGDLSELAARNLRESLLRNTLTMLGIAVGIASLVAMLSLGIGLQSLIGKRLERSGLFDSVAVRPRTGLGGQPGGPVRPANSASDLPPQPLDDVARQKFAHLPNVTEVYPDLRFTGDVRFQSQGRVTQIASLPASASSDDAFESMQGHFFSSPQAHEIILQSDVAKDLADTQHLQPNALIGQQIVLRYAGRQPLQPADADANGNAPAAKATAASRKTNQSADQSPDRSASQSPDQSDDQPQLSPDDAALGFSIVSSQIPLTIVGEVDADTMPSGAAGFGRSGGYVPVAVAEGLAVVQGNDMNELVRSASEGGGAHYSNLTVRVQSPTDVATVEDTIKQMGFTVFSLLDATQNLRRVFAIVDLLLGIFGSLALVVASLGIVNTLVMSILERRREIGVFKALGASDVDVRQLFFAEAGVMGLFGGAVGVALGWAIGQTIQLATTIYLRRQNIPAERIWMVPGWLVIGAIVFSVVVSLAAGMYPASRAAQLDPVEALRYQ
jgi:putative ABC transport system permease protein